MEKDFGFRALKEAGSKTIQDAITKAICELTGEEYEVDINSIDFDSDSGAWMRDRTKIVLTAKRTTDFYVPKEETEHDSASPA